MFPCFWIPQFLEKIRLDQPDALLHIIIDELHKKEHDTMNQWFRDMRAKLISKGDRSKTSDSAIIHKLFGDNLKDTFPDIARSTSKEHSTFQ